MKKDSQRAEVEVLIREIKRYLAFVEALRGARPTRSGSGGNADERGRKRT
jgi:hypothetical protein